MSVILLPLKPDKSSFTETGKWVAQPSLSNLVADFDALKKDKGFKVTSIPDIWAAPKAFTAQLIKNEKNIERSNWRAILAIIALRRILGYDLEVKRIEVPLDKNSDSFKNSHRFLQVISRLKIEESLKDDENNEFATINLICINNKTIALLWPDSIIYPVIPDDGLGDDVSWWKQDKKVFIDPSETGDFPEEHRIVLALWLEKLHESLIGGSTSTKGKIGECLSSFIADLCPGKNIDGLVKEYSQKYGFEEDGSFKIVGFGDVLNKVCSIPVSQKDIKSSQIRLASKKSQKTIFVVDKAIEESWNKKANQIFCFGSTYLNRALTLVADPDKRKALKENLENIGGSVWTVDDFFTDKISYVTGFAEGANPFPNSLTEKDLNKDKNMDAYGTGKFCKKYGKKFQEFILPIRKKVLEFFDSNDLVDIIEIVREKNNGPIKVVLNIKLTGSDQPVALTKVYDGTDKIDIIRRNALPNIQIWPNFTSKIWKQYYLFTGTSDNSEIVIEPDWSQGIENMNLDINAEGIKVKLRRGSAFPCNFVYKDNKGEERGLICIDSEKLINLKPPDEDVYIGVDFGTTNTVVYYTNDLTNSKAIEPLFFENRTFEVTRQSDADKVDLRRYFFPANRQPEAGSIRTIFHKFINIANDNEDSEKPLATGNIYYLESGKEDSQNVNDDQDHDQDINNDQDDFGDQVIVDELESNIKWDNDNNNLNRMYAFIYQLCLQATAEAVVKGAKKITWQYSWPSAFDNAKRIGYRKFWKDNLTNAINEFVDQNVASKFCSSDEVYDKTENRSMAEFFQKGLPADEKGLANTHGLLTIDIGGGSTDIALWKGYQENDNENNQKLLNNLHECSFKFAGNDIFSDYIKSKCDKNPDILSPLGVDKNLKSRLAKLKKLALNKNWKIFSLELESILKYYDKELIHGMDRAARSGEDNQNLNIVMRDIGFALGGIFYYAGSIIGCERMRGKIDEYFPDCFVGGNGSKLLNWASKGKFSENAEMKQFLRICILIGMSNTMKAIKKHSDNKNESRLENENDLVITGSKRPKHEVAFGLICGKGEKSNSSTELSTSGMSGGGLIEEFGDDEDLDESQSSAIETEENDKYAVYAGEVFNIGKPASWALDEKITEKNFTDEEKYISLKFNPGENLFWKYCELFDKIIQKFGRILFNGAMIKPDLKQDKVKRSIEIIEDKLKDNRVKNSDNIVVEPIFIMELREAMRILGEN